MGPIPRRALFAASVTVVVGVAVYLGAKSGGCAGAPDSRSAKILRVADRAVLSLGEVVPELKRVPLVFVGEYHDQPSHHGAQLSVIRALDENGARVAVGLEMFRTDDQQALDLWVRGQLPESRFLPVYERNWSLWPLYAEIFRFARDRRIPLVGLNVPREVTRQVARRGFSSLSPKQRGDLPPVQCDVDADYQEFIRRALGMSAKKGASFQNFCEAQLVWDASMAWHARQFLEKNPGYVVVVLAGSGHAWKRGIPEQVRRQSKLEFRVVLPEVPRLTRDDVTREDADYLWLDLPLERND